MSTVLKAKEQGRGGIIVPGWHFMRSHEVSALIAKA
jgi:hypothetical protein